LFVTSTILCRQKACPNKMRTHRRQMSFTRSVHGKKWKTRLPDKRPCSTERACWKSHLAPTRLRSRGRKCPGTRNYSRCAKRSSTCVTLRLLGRRLQLVF
ncbi:hypothetical protein EV177_009574, partial [Coemansia sp. RSA 1804]